MKRLSQLFLIGLLAFVSLIALLPAPYALSQGPIDVQPGSSAPAPERSPTFLEGLFADVTGRLLERLQGWMHKEADQVTDSLNQWLHKEIDRLFESLASSLAEPPAWVANPL